MSTAKASTAALAVVALFVGWATGAHAAQQSPASDLASACMREAQLGHAKAWRLEPSLRPMIEGQRTRMRELCTRLANAQSPERAALLDDCLREATQGPRHIQRGRNSDREHIARQQHICRALAR